MKERKRVVVNPYGRRVIMDVCPYPEKHCNWCIWLDERWLCDCRDTVKKLKKCCNCPDNNAWEKGSDICLRCALTVEKPTVPPSRFQDQLDRIESDTIKKWERPTE